MNWAATFAIGVHAAAVWLLYLAAMRFIWAGRSFAVSVQAEEAGAAPDQVAVIVTNAQENVTVGCCLMAIAIAAIVLVEVSL